MRKLAFFCACCLIMSSMLNGAKLIPSANGRSYPWTNASLRSVFMLNSSNIWTVGQSGTILRWEGSAWKAVASPTSSWLQSVYMNNDNDGWAVGSGGAIIYWNGTFWETVPSPTGENLYDVFMVDADDGWAVGWDGTTIHWNGTAWSTISSPTTRLLFSVYVVDSSNVWAVGDLGTLINWNGTAWNTGASPTTANIYDVFMVSTNDGWGVGTGGTIIRYNGTEWNNVSSPTTNGLRSVFMLNSTEGWAVGDAGTVIRWNGTAWNSVASPITGWFFSVFMIDDNDGWAVGDFGSIIRWNGAEWLESSTSIHQGDLIISGDDVFVIEDERFDINGSIIVEENATLIVRNAVINFTQKEWKQFNITLRNPVNGNPRLLVSNATIRSTPDFQFEIYFYGNSTADISHLYVHQKLIAYDTSWLNITDSPHIWHIDCRDSSSANISNSEFWYVKPYDMAHVSVKDSEVTMGMENYGTSTSSVSNTSIGFLGTYGSSITALSNCSISNLRPQGGTLSSLKVFDCDVDNFDVSTSCSIYMSNCTISSFEAQGVSNVTLAGCSVNGMYIHSSSIVTVFNELAANGSIIVEENATLILVDALVNFTQTESWQFELVLNNPANGNPKLHVSNTIVTSTYRFSINLYQNSSGVINDSQLTAAGGHYCWLWTLDSAFSSFHNLTVHGLSSTSSTGIAISDSTVTTLNIYDSCHTSAYNSTIQTANSYGAASFSAYGCVLTAVQTFEQSVASILDSTVHSLHAYNETTMWLTNSTYIDNFVYNESQVFVRWYLDVHVEDSIGQVVPSATVAASYTNGTQAESDLTDENGWTRLTLIEKMVNMTGDFPIGNYTIRADYDIYQDQATVNMIGNQDITLILSFVIPEFSSSITLILLMITAILLTLLMKKKGKD